MTQEIQQKKTFKQAKIIINPNSGQSKGKFRWLERLLGIKGNQSHQQSKEEIASYITSFLTRHQIYSKSFFTTHPGHATELAKNAQNEGYDLVIAVGGDGTINEVTNGLVHSTITLGIIPLGTANVMSIELNIPTDLELACQKIINGYRSTIDLAKINHRYFCCMAGIGFDANVIKKADTSLKKKLGPLSYVLVAMRELCTYKFQKIYLTLDNKVDIDGYFAIISNIKFYGGNFIVFPNANPDDGILDICVFKQKKILRYVYHLITKSLPKNKYIEYYQAKKIKVKQQGNHDIHVDAEYIGKGAVNINIMPNAIWVIR
ncbi:hypothetical protein DID75_04765 [Candidatus Marinamargulisbacteria bacterium SCGC AG-410-N11]|nr:hypothetical protein DID75_04765 [Candidatus Marinamargulisbacteria bacterium SCGC AG-410-N11]